MEGIIALLIPIASFAMVFGIVYVAVTASHRQKMAMIERGINPKKGQNHLEKGVTYTALALSAIVAFIFNMMFPQLINDNEVLTFIVSMLLFIGMAHLLSPWIKKRFYPEITDNSELEWK